MIPVEELEHRFLPLLEQVRQHAAKRFPDCRFAVYSYSVGSATTYLGHDVGLEAMLPGARPDETDSVTIVIGLMHLTTQPLVSEAAVVWGQGEHPDVDATWSISPCLSATRLLPTSSGASPSWLKPSRTQSSPGMPVAPSNQSVNLTRPSGAVHSDRSPRRSYVQRWADEGWLDDDAPTP